MRRALVVIYRSSQFAEMKHIAIMLNKTDVYEVIVYFAWLDCIKEKEIKYCQKEGMLCISPSGTELVSTAGEIGKKRTIVLPFHLLANLIQNILRGVISISPLIKQIFHYKKAVYSMGKIIDKQKPDIIILPCDHLGYETATIIKAAKNNKIPTVIVPFTFISKNDIVNECMNDDSCDLGKYWNKFAGNLFPHWVFERGGKRALRLPAAKLIAMEFLGLAPPLPWVFNSGYADGIIVESNFIYKHYIKEGIPAGKLFMTGSLSNDVMSKIVSNAKGERNKILGEMGISEEQLVVLCAIPGDLTHQNGIKCEFKNYNELLEYMISALNSIKDHRVIISMHPSVNPNVYKIYQDRNIIISKVDIVTLIPLCRLYISYVSGTIRWAIACGKPVILYDVYKNGCSDYSEIKGVIKVQEKGEFVPVLDRLLSDNTFYEQNKAEQIKISNNWGMMDGEAELRILKLFDLLIDEKNTSQTKRSK
jgi:hypothetical protein